ncbi:hypothetical protein E4T66_17635 [Sinimarinibacterium sp. CAU 1509]|uniref:hypothetical protein n=1 Tax=Sinimarinibacterium sp. CAU 1509 TaxID=2562283 RepID=UPI0010AD2C18|nr:hypothetical protein [Sinimarinibacterium sp. CAU 1509]TJY57230.1 hypothetical protein E4T66_17635 [Sinimarinibacterium sp. CAU 1509]
MSDGSRRFLHALTPGLRRALVSLSWMALISGFVAMLTSLYALPTGNEFRLGPVIVSAYIAALAFLALLLLTLLLSGAVLLLLDVRYLLMLMLGITASVATVHGLAGVTASVWPDWVAQGSLRIDYDPATPEVLRISGGMPSDLDRRVAAFLDSLSPAQRHHLEWIDLASEGGQLRAMVRTVGVLRAHGLTQMRAAGPCLSACALMWLMGERRVVLPGGSIGFHAPSTTRGEDAAALSVAVEEFVFCESGDPILARAAAWWPSSSMFMVDSFWLAERGMIGKSTQACHLQLPA